MSARRIFYLLVCAETLLAAALIIPGIGNKSLWLDEAVTVSYALDPLMYWKEVSYWDTNMWLYYTCLQGWAMIVPHTEAWLRGLSALFALLSIPAVVLVGTRLCSGKAGLLAGFFLAVHPFFIHYARETRSYTFLMLMSLAATYAFSRLMNKTPVRSGVAYGFTIAAGVFVHFYITLHAFAHALSLLVIPVRTWPWKKLFAAVFVMLAGISAMLIFIGPRNAGIMDWLSKPTLHDLYRVSMDLLGSSDLLALFYCACFLLAVVFAIRSKESRWAFTLLCCTVMVPVITSFLFSITVQPMLQARFLSTVVPSLALCSGAVLARMKPGILLAGVVIAIAFASAAPVKKEHAFMGRENWRELTEEVRGDGGSGDVMIFHTRYLINPVEVYEKMYGELPVDVVDLREMNLGGISNQDPPPEHVFDELAGTYARLWLVLGHNNFDHLDSHTKTAELMTRLGKHYQQISVNQYGTIKLLLWEQKTTP